MRRMYYAAYGSNLHPARLRRRLPRAELAGTAFLDDYTLQFHKRGRDNSAKCGITKCGRGLHVAIFVLSASCKRTLDGIEGVGMGYHVDWLQVPGFGRCFTYRATRSHVHDDLKPFDWYRELVLLGSRHHGFPSAYSEWIASVESISDPNPERRAENWRIVDDLSADNGDLTDA